MSVELARRLIQSGAVPAEEVERALFESVSVGMPFAQSLAARGADYLHALERELGKTHVPLAHSVRVAVDLGAELPLGLCERLLAVPIGRDPRTAACDIACVDPLDPQIASEFSYHLRGPVRVYRAPLTEVLLALELWLDEHDAQQALGARTPAFGTQRVDKRSSPPAGRLSLRPPPALTADASGVPVRPSEPPPSHASQPPIPLVRRSLAPDPAGLTDRLKRGTDPGVGDRSSLLMIPETDDAGEPVIGLYRSKPPPPPTAVQISTLPEERMKQALERMQRASSAQAIAAALVFGLEALATRALVLAVRGDTFEGRIGSASLGDAERLRDLSFDARAPSVLRDAAQNGYFLGLLPPTPVHAPLVALFGDGELYVARVDVSGRPALLFVMAGLETAFGATRRADELSRAASQALERIVRARKTDERR